MPLYIKNPEAEKLAREVAQQMGLSLTEAVLVALRQQHRNCVNSRHIKHKEGAAPEKHSKFVRNAIEIAKRYNARPTTDFRTPEEILGYDEYGLPS